MKKLLFTVGFLSFLSFEQLIAATADLREEFTQNVSSALSGYPGARRLTLSILEDADLLAKFHAVFHSDVSSLTSIATSLVPLGKDGTNVENFIERLFQRQEEKNAAAATATAAAVDVAGTRKALKGASLTELQTGVDALDDGMKKQQATIARLTADIAATERTIKELEGQGEAYKSANALVGNVSNWLKDHKDLDQTITDPATAAQAWVDRRDGLNKISASPNNQTKLALARSVLALVKASPTADVMTAATTAYEDQISTSKQQLKDLRAELKGAKGDLTPLATAHRKTASQLKSSTPKAAASPSGSESGKSPSKLSRAFSWKKSSSGTSTPTGDGAGGASSN